MKQQGVEPENIPQKMKQNPTIVITGAAGTIGEKLRELWSERYQIKALTHSRPLSSSENCEVFSGFDMTDENMMDRYMAQMKEMGARTVLNLATGTNDLEKSEEQHGDKNGSVYQTNVVGARNMARACKKYGLKLIHLSTAYVFDGRKPFPGRYLTTDDTNAQNLDLWYPMTKQEGEKTIMEEYKEGSVILRIPPIQTMVSGQFIRFFRELTSGKQYSALDDRYISPVTIWTLSRVLEAIEKAMNADGFSGICHIGCTDACSYYGLARLFCSVMGLDHSLLIPVTEKSLRSENKSVPPRPSNPILDITEFHQRFPGILHSVEDEMRLWRKHMVTNSRVLPEDL